MLVEFRVILILIHISLVYICICTYHQHIIHLEYFTNYRIIFVQFSDSFEQGSMTLNVDGFRSTIQRNLIFDSFKAPQQWCKDHSRPSHFSGWHLHVKKEKQNQFHCIYSRNGSWCMYNVLVRKMKFQNHQWSSCYFLDVYTTGLWKFEDAMLISFLFTITLFFVCLLMAIKSSISCDVFTNFHPLKVMRFSFGFHLKMNLFPNGLLSNLVNLGIGET